MPQSITILIIEDEAVQAMYLNEQLVSYGYHVAGTAPTGRKALSLFQDYPVDLVLCDIGLPGEWDGIQTVHKLIQQRPVPIIYLTGRTDTDTFVRAQQTNPAAFLVKPCDNGTLRRAIEMALDTCSLRKLMPQPLPDSGRKIALRSSGLVIQPQALRRQKTNNTDTVFIKKTDQFVRVRLADVLYLEADDTMTMVVTADQRYPIRLPLGTVLTQLANDRLSRTHRSFAVNLDQVESFSEWDIRVGNRTLPVGRTYRDAFLENFPFC